ncbi:MAG TPA: DUF2924 domain-containing protein [Kofleriaceae bacterium]|nr:DUF2924 domain-containing protein [Kofleriaceae bacterium]
MGSRSALAQREDGATIVNQRRELAVVANTRRELVALEAMTVGELAEKYRALFGIPTRTRNKAYLRKHIAWRIQELAEGGLSPRALDRIEQLAPQVPVRWQTRIGKADATAGHPSAHTEKSRDPRLPPVGTVLTRVYNGVEHKVAVLADGFEYNGTCHRSLSKVARLIAGTSWNGFTFFFGRTLGALDGETEHAR